MVTDVWCKCIVRGVSWHFVENDVENGKYHPLDALSTIHWCEKARKHICVTNRHDITLAVEVALNPSTTNRSTIHFTVVKMG